MNFEVVTSYRSDPDAVAAAYADPTLYTAFGDLPRAGRPEVLWHEEDDGEVHLDVRWNFTAPLSAAARAVIDPSRLSWVEKAVHVLASRTVTYELVADHYADRFSCRGRYRFEPSAGGTTRHSQGDLRIKAPLVARAVEGAIVDGLREQLHAEVPIVERFLHARGAG